MKQVLIIDDSKQIRERVAALLTESGQVRIVGTAGNGETVMEAIKQLAPDTVILDIELPGISGIKILKAIKNAYPKVTVVMLTNYDLMHYRRLCTQLGADYFLSKTREINKIVPTVTGHSDINTHEDSLA